MKESFAEKLKSLVKDMNLEDKKKLVEAIIAHATKEKKSVSVLQNILGEMTEVVISRKKRVNIQEIQRLIFELDDDWFEKSKEEKVLILEESLGIKILDTFSKKADEDDEELLTHTS